MAARLDPLAPPALPDAALEPQIRAIGLDLLARMDRQPSPGILSMKGAQGRLMEWSLREPAFKAQLLRFVDVLPVLDSASEVVRHLREYLGERAGLLHPALKAGLGAASLAPALVAGPIRAQVTAMARQFVAGETVADLVERLRANAAGGRATTIDLLGEAVLTEAEADAFLARNLEVLDACGAAVRHGPPCLGDLGPGGPEPRVNLSVKASALAPDPQPADPDAAVASLSRRLRPILRRASEAGAFVNLDMESTRWKDVTLTLFRDILEEPEFLRGPPAGIAIQAYLRESEDDLRALIAWARARGRRIGVRLVKGAYWDTEMVLARQRGWPVPVFARKPETDACFERLTTLLLQSADAVQPAFATHNVRSCAHAVAVAERLGVDRRAYEFQALYGMADDLKAALVERGQRVREYCAVGALLPGMAFLVRRLLENTSNESFLRQRHAGLDPGRLLRSPAECLAEVAPARAPAAAPEGAFRNAPGADFTRADPRERMRGALAAVTAELGRSWPLVVGGKPLRTGGETVSVNPAHPEQVIGRCGAAGVAEADAAVAAARAAFPGWARTPAAERAAVLDRAAALLEERRFRFDALLALEAGKPWLEADGEVSEAIDFCRFYAAEARRLTAPRLTQEVPGERCHETWIPRGVGVSIAPWNFPLAILTGLTVAPLVAGNAVVMKPSGETPVLAAWLFELLTEAGLPHGVLAYLPGPGRTAGARLCEHPGTDFIAFTGSREVGCALWQLAGRTGPGQENLKRVVCEMGGKNAIVVDADADLDEAIPAVLHGAFGYAGQKCSACSRAIVLDAVYDRFLARLTAACASLPVGDPAQPGTVVGPVIDGAARDRILSFVEQGRREARLAYQAAIAPALAASGGHYVPPTIFADVGPGAAIAREEIFGPVLAVLRARDLDEAFALANGVDYALTAGLFSRSPAALERARTELAAGNVYLNRGITGAVVERHPFGGYRMSGGGTKAGGRGYLENFMFPRVVAENVLRRGFAPDEG